MTHSSVSFPFSVIYSCPPVAALHAPQQAPDNQLIGYRASGLRGDIDNAPMFNPLTYDSSLPTMVNETAIVPNNHYDPHPRGFQYDNNPEDMSKLDLPCRTHKW